MTCQECESAGICRVCGVPCRRVHALEIYLDPPAAPVRAEHP